MLTLDTVKDALRVTHDSDDALLYRLIESGKRECLRFLDIEALPDFADYPDLEQGIILMIQADYDADPLERNNYRRAAETLWMPFREELSA